MSQSKTRLLELNARLAQNLVDKGVEATADETTTDLVDKVADISTSKEEQEISVDITENGTTEILPDEGKALSKVTVNVDVADRDDNSTLIQLIERSEDLTTFNVPSGTTRIGGNAFTECRYLNKLIIPESVTTIGSGAFDYCIRLSYIDIPESVATISGVYVFRYCSSLPAVVLKSKVNLGNILAFNGCNANIYVRQSYLEWYSTATNWSSLYEEGRILAIEDNIEYLQGLGYVFEEVAE